MSRPAPVASTQSGPSLIFSPLGKPIFPKEKLLLSPSAALKAEVKRANGIKSEAWRAALCRIATLTDPAEALPLHFRLQQPFERKERSPAKPRSG